MYERKCLTISDLFESRIFRYNLRNSDHNLTQPSYNNRFYHNSFTYKASHLWNQLPSYIKAWFPYDRPYRPSRLQKCSDDRDDHMKTLPRRSQTTSIAWIELSSIRTIRTII